MGDRRKRKLEDFDPNASDPADSDFDVRATHSTPRSRKSRTARSINKSRKPVKRVKQSYADSDDDIIDDEDDDLDESEDGFDESDSEEEEPVVNPKTGRRVRTAAKKEVKYEEDSDEEIEEASASDSDILHTTSPRKKEKGSLIVKLKVPSMRRSKRSRTASRGAQQHPTPEFSGARRSSRISRNSEEPLMSLTGSGRHAEVSRPGTATPEPVQSRATRGGKGLKSVPSTVMEDSQEASGVSREAREAGDFLSQLEEHAGQAEEAEGGDDAGEPASPARSDTHADDIKMSEGGEEEEEEEKEEGEGAHADDDDEDEDDVPVSRSRTNRSLRARPKTESPPRARRSLRPRRSGVEQSSDFEPDAEAEAEEENVSSSDDLARPQRRMQKSDNESSSAAGGRRSTRLAGKRSQHQSDEDADELDLDEIADEAALLEEDRRRNKRPRKGRRDDPISYEPNLRTRSKRPDYRVFRPELLTAEQDDDAPAPTASQRNRRAAGPYRSLFSTLGPFGGAGGPMPVFGGPEGTGAAGGAESDSSDDEAQQKQPRGHGSIGGAVGMTPTSAGAHNPFPQAHGDTAQGGTSGGGGPANFGKVKDKKALADADPLGVDPNVDFEGVGGLDDHINRLKEMVALPLLYPEVFQRFHVTPPRGVLFHGPPGTGKTLLARALASSVSSHGKKVTFYMRKGADALSKWVGEAERQLRLLFEEARKNQPSIIFFDEIDGLAPVRSSKQEQIHASIVATLLALMDGMDGRGQVIVIGATNRPDSVDPALRRPGRFDREFYFPLPNVQARRAIIDIHTKNWDPPLKPQFKDNLAEVTKGYGGADLRALCTEAALNAVQGTYPQIYQSDKKLIIDPSTIKVLAKDFMISVSKMIPSSERSASSGAAPLSKSIEPLLRKALDDISARLNEVLPRRKKATALEEAMFDDRDDEKGFEKETMQREFESARIFRPRLLVRGLQGMGQQYVGAALLSKFEGLHVQNFDLPTLLKDSTRSAEAAVVQLFEEVKRHKPSVIYIPNVDVWYQTLSDSTIRTFTGLLRSLPPTDPVLLLGIMEAGPVEDEEQRRLEKAMMRDLFGYSTKNSYELRRPSEPARREYFASLVTYIQQPPSEFPNPDNRKPRQLPDLPEAPVMPNAPQGPSKEELKAQKKQDRHTLNTLKLNIQIVMDQIKLKYKKFRTPIIDEKDYDYLFDEQDPNILTTDLGDQQMQQIHPRPYELATDRKGVQGIRETATGKFYYNLEIVTIEKRLSNGYYKRPKDFLADIKRLAKDAKTNGDQERTLKANELVANVEVDMMNLEHTNPALVAECEAVFNREEARAEEQKRKAQEARQQGRDVPVLQPNVPPHISNTTTETSGPVHLGVDVPGPRGLPPVTPQRMPGPSPLSHGYSLSNGSHQPQSNGSTVPSGYHEDSEMAESDTPHHHQNPHERGSGSAFHSLPSAAQGTQGTTTGNVRSQTGPRTRLDPGSQLDDYHNSASTTTSGQKTSDRSSGGGGGAPHSAHTQRSNGYSNGDVPEFGALPPLGPGGSQLPDTQELYGSSQSQPEGMGMGMGMGMGPPPATAAAASSRQRATSINALLNNPSETSTTQPPPPQLIPVPLPDLERVSADMVAKSSGLSVEQLEQVMARLMNAVWESKDQWNRNRVVEKVVGAFNECVADIEACQAVLEPSQEGGGAGGRK